MAQRPPAATILREVSQPTRCQRCSVAIGIFNSAARSASHHSCPLSSRFAVFASGRSSILAVLCRESEDLCSDELDQVRLPGPWGPRRNRFAEAATAHSVPNMCRRTIREVCSCTTAVAADSNHDGLHGNTSHTIKLYNSIAISAVHRRPAESSLVAPSKPSVCLLSWKVASTLHLEAYQVKTCSAVAFTRVEIKRFAFGRRPPARASLATIPQGTLQQREHTRSTASHWPGQFMPPVDAKFHAAGTLVKHSLGRRELPPAFCAFTAFPALWASARQRRTSGHPGATGWSNRRWSAVGPARFCPP